MNGYVYDRGRGRFGNCVFRFLASRLFCILYKLEYIDTHKTYMEKIEDQIFIIWSNYLLENKLIQFPVSNFSFELYYQHDMIYRKYRNELLEYIRNNPEQKLITDKDEIYYVKELLQKAPILDKSYNTVVHLRIEDYFEINNVLHPKSIDNVLEKCEGPFLFIHKSIESNYDKLYIDYFKNKYTDAIFFDGSVIDSYNLMREATTLICSNSTMSWVAALLSISLKKVFVPKNNCKELHNTFQYPIDNTEVYEYDIILKNSLNTLNI